MKFLSILSFTLIQPAYRSPLTQVPSISGRMLTFIQGRYCSLITLSFLPYHTRFYPCLARWENDEIYPAPVKKIGQSGVPYRHKITRLTLILHLLNDRIPPMPGILAERAEWSLWAHSRPFENVRVLQIRNRVQAANQISLPAD